MHRCNACYEAGYRHFKELLWTEHTMYSQLTSTKMKPWIKKGAQVGACGLFTFPVAIPILTWVWRRLWLCSICQMGMETFVTMFHMSNCTSVAPILMHHVHAPFHRTEYKDWHCSDSYTSTIIDLSCSCHIPEFCSPTLNKVQHTLDKHVFKVN
jgi:hypothetical protein